MFIIAPPQNVHRPAARRAHVQALPGALRWGVLPREPLHECGRAWQTLLPSAGGAANRWAACTDE